MRGTGVLHVTGAPDLTVDEERAHRRRLVEQGLEALTSKVDSSRVFNAEGAAV